MDPNNSQYVDDLLNPDDEEALYGSAYVDDTETLDERLGYDADHSDPHQYCRHGTFIGSWWGPDYMCGYCESGEE